MVRTPVMIDVLFLCGESLVAGSASVGAVGGPHVRLEAGEIVECLSAEEWAGVIVYPGAALASALASICSRG